MEKWPWDESFELDMELVFQAIKSRGAKRVLLQLPDGLRDHSSAMARAVEEATGAQAVLAGGACFGACDPATLAGTGAELLIQFGHSPIPSVAVRDAIFVRAKSTLPIEGVVRRATRELSGTRVGLLTTAQFAHRLDEAASILRQEGFEPRVGKGDERIALAGQVLGCNYTVGKAVEREVDCFLYIGSGDFHPLGMALETAKPLVVADPENGSVRRLDGLRDRILRQRFAAIQAAKDARTFAVLVSTKPGQLRMKLADELKALLVKHGREACLVALDTFTPESLLPWRKMDCWVNTACPRIATDDFSKFPVPMVTPPELEVALGIRKWADGYVFDEISGDRSQHELPGAAGKP